MLLTIVSTMTMECMSVFVYAAHVVRTVYTRSHVNTLAAVKLLLVAAVASNAGL